MSNLQAAFGLGQLERVDELIEAKRRIFSWYRDGLDGVPGITLNHETAWARSIYWMTSIRVGAESGSTSERLTSTSAGREDRHPAGVHADQPVPVLAAPGRPQPTPTAIGAEGINLPSGVRCGARRSTACAPRSAEVGVGRLAESGDDPARPADLPAGSGCGRPRPRLRTCWSRCRSRTASGSCPSAIESVLAQRQVDLRLEIYDNGSTDGRSRSRRATRPRSARARGRQPAGLQLLLQHEPRDRRQHRRVLLPLGVRRPDGAGQPRPEAGGADRAPGRRVRLVAHADHGRPRPDRRLLPRREQVEPLLPAPDVHGRSCCRSARW